MKKNILIICLILVLIFIASIVMFFLAFPIKYIDLVEKYSAKYNLDARLVLSVINVESSFDKTANSSAGALGLMQLLPSTATEIAHKLSVSDFTSDMLFEPETNINFGCFYIRYLLNLFNNDQTKALCAYNAGYNNVLNWLDENGDLNEIPFKETKNYVNKINSNLKVYKCIY